MIVFEDWELDGSNLHTKADHDFLKLHIRLKCGFLRNKLPLVGDKNEIFHGRLVFCCAKEHLGWHLTFNI